MVKKKTKADWRTLVPVCEKLQRAGYKLANLRMGWRAAERGGADHLSVPAAACKAAHESGIESVTVLRFEKDRAPEVAGKLVGLGNKVAYIAIDERVLTFSLSHGRCCYGSQHRFRGKLSDDDLSALLRKVAALSDFEQSLLDSLDDPTTVRDLVDKLDQPRTTVYHALMRLLRRRLVVKTHANGADHFHRNRRAPRS